MLEKFFPEHKPEHIQALDALVYTGGAEVYRGENGAIVFSVNKKEKRLLVLDCSLPWVSRYSDILSLCNEIAKRLKLKTILTFCTSQGAYDFLLKNGWDKFGGGMYVVKKCA